ncbi:MAG: hypothetical protein GXY86_14185 [Firmicutes bacterium]|nr:hypothetical protein [Bacillota bacterium]
MKEVSYFNYGNYSSNNYGVNTLCFTNDNGKFWFSYKTLVAFSVNNEFHIIKNYWGTTTGKHLNFINSDKSIREDKETFEANYKRLVKD